MLKKSRLEVVGLQAQLKKMPKPEPIKPSLNKSEPINPWGLGVILVAGVGLYLLRKEEFTQLKEKINQLCQILLEAIEKDITPKEEEVLDMLGDGLVNLPPTVHETDEYRNVENLRLRLENSLQDEYEKIQQKRNALGESVNDTIEMLYSIYELMFHMYVNFVEAMEAERQR